MKKFLPFITIIGLFSCSSPTDKASTNDSLSTDTVAVVDTLSKSISPTTKWTYQDQEDKMTSKKKFFASIDANELLDFDFPYNGGSTANLTIRHQNGANEALLSVSKGQFNTGVDGTNVKIRIDDAPATTYSASEPSDGSRDLLFINGASKLIKKLKTAKKVLIQAEFYNSGNKVMEFDVAGFKWTH